MAGPVVAAACHVPLDFNPDWLDRINDSKGMLRDDYMSSCKSIPRAIQWTFLHCNYPCTLTLLNCTLHITQALKKTREKSCKCIAAVRKEESVTRTTHCTLPRQRTAPHCTALYTTTATHCTALHRSTPQHAAASSSASTVLRHHLAYSVAFRSFWTKPLLMLSR